MYNKIYRRGEKATRRCGLLSSSAEWREVGQRYPFYSGSEDRSMSGAKATTVHARSPSQQRMLEPKLQQNMAGAALDRLWLEQRSTEQSGTPSITLYHYL